MPKWHRTNFNTGSKYAYTITATNKGFEILPSPVLCPHRTFLASLIIALKLTQDRCYSNKT